jgi:very-short-patch-repair endonuclease
MSELFDSAFYDPSQNIFENARFLRMNMTDAERRLWKKLESRKFRNLKFRRKHPLKKYILDFYCPEYKVAIDVDDGIHSKTGQVEYDKPRTEYLRESGIREIRFTEEDIILDINETLRKIESFLTLPSPHSGKGVAPKS